MKAIHNQVTEQPSEAWVVFKEQKYDKWKQFTTRSRFYSQKFERKEIMTIFAPNFQETNANRIISPEIHAHF